MLEEAKVCTMNNSPIGYFKFLCDLTGTKSKNYIYLLQYLHNVEFYSLVPNDDNRSSDGEQLRDRYLSEEYNGDNTVPTRPCSMLEMLIGLSFRLEFELLGGRYEKPASHWFWVLLDNLDILWATDEMMKSATNVRKVMLAVESFLNRRYDTDGNGGLFPLTSPEKDQRRVEIWYQMSAWIIENYPI